MGPLIFLDSDVLVDLASGAEPIVQAVQDLHEQGEPLATTSVNVAEFLRAIPPGAAQATARRFLGAFTEAPVGPRAARRFGLFMQSLDRSGHRIEEADGLVAAVVMEEGGRLLTRNVRRFRRVPGLELVPLPS